MELIIFILQYYLYFEIDHPLFLVTGSIVVQQLGHVIFTEMKM
jgi:hypothetical protein